MGRLTLKDQDAQCNHKATFIWKEEREEAVTETLGENATRFCWL